MTQQTREERQADLDARVTALRAQSEAKAKAAARIRSSVNDDPAFWTQPAYGNAGGRSFARQRDRERGRIVKANGMMAEAKALSDKADAMEARGVVMAGDAAAAREAVIAKVDVTVGQIVETTFYGPRKVLKVNAKTVLVEGAFGPLKVEKQYVRSA